VTTVGFLNGDLIAWRRWWLPAGEEPTLWQGLLPDPCEGNNRFLNCGLVRLADSAGVRARVLLADGGMGKSTELQGEFDRLRAAGELAELVDLGAYTSAGEVKDAIWDAARSWRDVGAPSDFVLALDGFDEPLVDDVVNLSEVLVDVLGRLDTRRLRVIVASRTSLWRPTLQKKFAQWWGEDQVVSLCLAPLTAADIAAAASSEDLDGDEFLDAVRATGAGPLAARPITLRLLLAGARDGALPSQRLDVYRAGVAGLAGESGARRLERRRTGTTLNRRLEAARRLATVSLLTGRPAIVRRLEPGRTPAQLALDEVADDDVGLGALDDVWDSALLARGDVARSWCHHSVAEYLCAETLARLPVATAWRLLAAPSDPTRLRPQLEETAAWTASIGDGMFDRLAGSQPWLLINANLPGRPAQDRERVGRAVVKRLGRGDPVLDRVSADALNYAGIEHDLGPLLDAGKPHWQRREAVMLIASAGLQGLDNVLLAIVEESAGRTGYGDAVELAVYAAYALAHVADPGVIGRMHALLGDAGTPDRVRAALVVGLFPDRLGVDELAALVDPQHRFIQPFGRTVVHAMREAVSCGKVGADELIEWFTKPTDTAASDDRTRELAAAAALTAVAGGPAGSRWQTAVSVVVWLLRSPCHLGEWSAEIVEALGPDLRRELCRAVLEGRSDDSLADALAQRGLLRAEDLLWWLAWLAEGLRGEGDGGLSATAAVRVLAWLVVDDDDALAAAREQCAATPALTAVADQELSEQAVAERRRLRARAADTRRQHEAEQAKYLFSPHRLAQWLAVGDFFAALDELRRQPAREDRPAGPDGPLPAWTTASEGAKQETVRLGAARLASHEPDLDDIGEVHELGETIGVVAAGGDGLLDTVPADRWGQWLRALLTSSSVRAAQICLRRALAHDPSNVAAALMDMVDNGVRGAAHLSPWLLNDIPAPMLGVLADRALAHANRPDVPVETLPGLLAVGNAGRPSESCRVALGHIGRVLGPPPEGIRNRDDPTVAAWWRSVAAACALIGNAALAEAYDDLLATFEAEPRLAVEAVRRLDAWQRQDSWRGLQAEQIARLYLWARTAMPSRRIGSSVILRTDHAEELPNDLIAVLTGRADGPSVRALEDLAIRTNNVYLRSEAERLASAVAAKAAAPPSPQAVLAVLQDPSRRAITSTAQLAEVVLGALDEIAADLLRDRELRGRLWERQRDGTKWTDRYVPVEEIDLAEQLKSELKRRLLGRIAVAREVEIQPRLSQTSADRPDVLAIAMTTDIARIELPIEVKGNYHRHAITALRSQLADRYLAGPVGTEGIYVVGYFHGNNWEPTDKSRRRTANQHSINKLRARLENEARTAAKNGKTVHVRVLDIPLDLDPRPETS
jgi:hypothetical protein